MCSTALQRSARHPGRVRVGRSRAERHHRQTCIRRAGEFFGILVSRLISEVCARPPSRPLRPRLSAVAHWTILQIGIHGEKIEDWKQQTAPARLQSECSHPEETLQSVSNGRAFSIGCRPCHARWRIGGGTPAR